MAQGEISVDKPLLLHFFWTFSENVEIKSFFFLTLQKKSNNYENHCIYKIYSIHKKPWKVPMSSQCGRTLFSPANATGVGCPLRFRLLSPHGPPGWHPPPSAPSTLPGVEWIPSRQGAWLSRQRQPSRARCPKTVEKIPPHSTKQLKTNNWKLITNIINRPIRCVANAAHPQI